MHMNSANCCFKKEHWVLISHSDFLCGLVHLLNCCSWCCWFQPAGLQPVACLQSRLCSEMRRRGNHPAELLFPCPLTVAAAAVVVMWREKPAKKSAANWKERKGNRSSWERKWECVWVVTLQKVELQCWRAVWGHFYTHDEQQSQMTDDSDYYMII